MTSEERLQRLEDAVSNLLVLVTEGQLARVERYVGPGCSDAGRTLMEMREAIRQERDADAEARIVTCREG